MMIKVRTKSRIKSLPIETIRRKFRTKREWLLIAVETFDDSTTTALTGRLIAHSPHRDEIMRKQIKLRGHLLIDYSEDTLPPNTTLMF